MRETDILDELLDRDFNGYELRSVVNDKNIYYDKYEKREALKKRQEARRANKKKDMEERAKELVLNSTESNVAKSNNIKAYMLSQGIKHNEVAYVLGIDACTLSRWIRPANVCIHEEQIKKAVQLIVSNRRNYINDNEV